MNKKNNLLYASIIGAILSVLPLSEALAASNFTINPYGSLPTTVPAAGSVSAYYTITNQTRTTRTGYRIQGLPATVAQDTSAGYCPRTMTLPADASCLLKLNVYGEAKSNFALCRGSSCTSASVALNVSRQATPPPLVAAGQYLGNASFAPDTKVYPLILANTASGWAYTLTSTNMPVGATNVQITDVSCNSTACFAVGRGYTDNPDTPSIVLAKGDKFGANWVYQTLPMSPVIGALNSVKCTEAMCVVAGSSGDLSVPDDITPVLYRTTNNGQSWSSESISGGPNRGSINSLYCNQNVCIATGGYTDTTANQTFAYILKANSNGSNWQYSYSPVVAGDAYLLSASCNASACVSVGFDKNIQNHVLTLVGDTQGGNWSINNSGIIPLPNNTSRLYNVTCTTTSCIAVGQHGTADEEGIYGLIATSDATGTNWTYTSLNTVLSLRSALLSINCSTNACIAVGGTLIKQGQSIALRPLIITGSLNGTDWKLAYYPTSQSVFASVVCNASTCFTVGVSFTGAPTASLSMDNGANWFDVISATSPAVPSNLILGQLFSASINNAASTSASSAVGFLSN